MRLINAGLGALKLGAIILGLTQAAVAFPLDVNTTNQDLSDYEDLLRRSGSNLAGRADPHDFYLRIMPLGASIVRGQPAEPGDEDKNGFRKAVRDKLRWDGWKVNMVGSISSGTMADNDVQAVPGETIDQTHGRLRTSAPIWQPNLYLINCGTNDAAQDKVAGAGERMRNMIETIFSITPDATVILSTLLQHGEFQSRVLLINDQYRRLVKDLQGPNLEKPVSKVYLAEMQDGFLKFPEEFHDPIHPNRVGFRKMAAVWVYAINQVNELNWLSAPSRGRFPDGESHSTCRKEFGSGAGHEHGAGVQLLFAGDPTIRDDGPYQHSSQGHGVVWKGRVFDDTEMYWAQLVDFGAPREQALDELVLVNRDTDSIDMYVNRGNGNFDAGVKIKVGHFCINRGIHFGDVNGDGLDDYICIAPDGTPFVAINTSARGQVVPTFGAFFRWRNPISGYGQDRVRLGDIDGDGRLDYCVIHDSGNIHCYRNGGLGNGAAYWQDLGSGGPVFTAKGMGDWRGVRFVDLNGDGRFDWLWLSTQGQTTTWINKRGEKQGLVPYWQGAGVTHPGMGEDIGDARDRAKFGRVFNKREGFRDYGFFKRTNCGSAGVCDGTVSVWENVNGGNGGRWQKGDGARWGDVTGTGFDDYIWISAYGEVTIFPNKARKNNFDWYKSTAWGGTTLLKTGFRRRALHIADWNGDGKADIIGVNRATGELTIWHSSSEPGKVSFGEARTFAYTAGFCNLGWGVLYHDTAHHFADIDGDGRADYICIRPNGIMHAMLNLATGNKNIGQIKYTEDLDRANFGFADVNGDGLADIIHSDKFTGDTRVFYNEGQAPDREANAGSAWKWERPTNAYKGSSRGPNLMFPSLSGQGRADMVEVNPNTAHGWISFNTCPAGGDDPEGVVNPNLPQYSPGNSPEVPSPGNHFFCDTNAGLWTPGLWQQQDMGSWFLDRSRYYSGLERNWPFTGGSDGVPRVIAWYELDQKDNAFNWPGASCQSINHDCTLSESDLKNINCRVNWRRAFTLWSMRNLVLYLQSFHNIVLRTTVRTSLDTSYLAANFLATENPDMNPSAWLTIAAGMITSLASISPGTAGQFGNGFAGMLTSAAGVAAFLESSPSFDPRFDSFADLQGKLGAIVAAVEDATEKYFHRLIIERPPNFDMDRGTELASILASGVMADQDFGTGETSVDPRAQRQLLRAPLLSEVWNGQDVFIVKFGEKQVDLEEVNFKYSPCFDHNQEVEELGRHNACTGGANWMIGRWASDPHQMFVPELGTAKDKLERLEFTKEQIVERALQIQQRTGQFRPRGMNHLQLNLKDLAASQQPKLEEALWFNIPVCDLTQIQDSLNYGDSCYEDFDGPAYTQTCMYEVVKNNCHRVKLRGQDWPM